MNTSSQSQPVLGQSAQTEADTSAALKPSEVLERAASLIEPEGAWTQGAYGRASDGTAASARGSRTVCWCAAGAALKVSPFGPIGSNYFERVTGRLLEGFNDAEGRTQAEVVAALRKAAELARSEGQ